MAVTFPALRVEHLSMTAGDRTLIRDLSLSLAHGETLGVHGPSGVGKTTLARAVAGLMDGAEGVTCRGRILVGGVDVATDRRGAQRVRGREVVLIPQNALTSLPPLLRVGDLGVALAGGHDGAATSSRLAESLGRLGVADPDRVLQARPADLSGGERQRVLLAIALLRRPRLLIADEPTTALDAASRTLVEQAFDRAHRAVGFALMVISHDRALLERLCERELALGDHGDAVREGRRRPPRSAVAGAPRPVGPDPGREAGTTPADAAATAPPSSDAGDRGILAAERLTIRRGGHVLLDDVRLSVDRAARLAVLGRSGAGKTTLVRALAGLARPSHGEVSERLHGGEAWRRLRRPNRRVQLLFQDPAAAFDPRLTVFESIVLAADRTLRRASERRSALAALAERVHLDPAVLDRGPRQISGGECQRAALLRALLCEPLVLLADEPTSSLDVEAAQAVQTLLSTLVEERHLSLVLVSHDLAFVRATCTHAVVLADGVVSWTGPVANLSSP